MKTQKLLTHSMAAALVALLGLTSLTSCSRERAKEKDRTFVPKMGGQIDDPTTAFPDVDTAFEAPKGACAQVTELASMSVPAGMKTFRFLSAMNVGQQGMEGAIEIGGMPLYQVAIAGKFKLPTVAEFLKKAKEAYEKGEISKIKYLGAKAICSRFGRAVYSKLCTNAIYDATNEKLEESFPGVFGKSPQPMGKSLALLQMSKAVAGADALRRTQWAQALPALTAKLPLFSSADWGTSTREMRDSLAAAMGSFLLASNERPASEAERLCGMVLIERAFAQLLALKGYQAVAYVPSTTGPQTKMDKLAKPATTPKMADTLGAFVDANEGKNVILVGEAIKNYNPADGMKLVGEQTPDGNLNRSAGGLSEQVAMLESMIYAFEAMSPASLWVTGKENYLLGDIAATTGRALVPADATGLALGLFGMSFKNVAAMGIHKITAQGKIAGAGDTVAGIMLAELPAYGHATTRMKLSDVTSLVRTVVFTEAALKRFKSRPLEEWAQFQASMPSPTLTKELLIGLGGHALVTDEELATLMPDPAARENILFHKLEQLHLPLALLMGTLGHDADRCAGEIEWNPSNGERRSARPCTSEEFSELQAARQLLARITKSPILGGGAL